MIESLVRIQVPTTYDYEFLPHGQGVYFSKLTKDAAGYGPYYSQWTSDTINNQRLVVGAVFIGNNSYPMKDSLADCEDDEMSFYFNKTTQILYIHFEFDEIPESSTVAIGIQTGYSLVGTEESIYIDDVEYQPRIISLPDIEKSVDKFQAGKMTFDDVAIELSNGDAELDSFIQNPIPGAQGSVVLYDTEADTELTYVTGFVTSDVSTTESYSIKLEDKRRRENIKIPRTRFDDTTYSDIESKYVGKVIPEGYGDVVRIKCTPLNGTVGSGNIDFKYATDATTLTKVEVEEDDVWTDVTGDVLNSSPSTGYFELPYADATNASGAVLKCVCTATLRNYDNPGDIIADMNDRYNSVNYDATNYDTTEWASESAKLADVALYMEKDKEFFKWIEDIQNGSDIWFLYYIQGDGKRTLRVSDPDRAISRAVRYDEIKDDSHTVERDFSEYSSTVAVLYNKDWADDVYERIDVDTYEEDVLKTYLFSQDSEFESLLTAEADAQTKADVIAEDQQEARPVAIVILHGDDLDKLDLELYDIVTVDLADPGDRYWEAMDDSITALHTASDSYTALHTASDSITAKVGQFVSTRDGREYWGTIRGQVIGISYNPTNLDYTITVRERPESEVI